MGRGRKGREQEKGDKCVTIYRALGKRGWPRRTADGVSQSIVGPGSWWGGAPRLGSMLFRWNRLVSTLVISVPFVWHLQ